MTVRRPRNAFLFLALAAALAGCEEQEITPTGIVHPTLIEVSPDDFLADVPCSVGPGSMQVYVATLHDYGPVSFDEGAGGEGGATAGCPSVRGPEVAEARRSDPVACGTAVGFARVTPNHCYSVDIAGFDRTGLFVHEPGQVVDPTLPPPPILDATTLQTVEPRWTTTCEKAAARSYVVRRIRDCEPLVDHQPSAVTAVEIRPELSLGDVTCGTGPDEVEHFELVTPSGARSVACGDPLLLEDAAPGRTVVIDVLAFARGDADALLGSTCTATALTGVTVTATCSPFTDKGALEIDPNRAASALGFPCDTLRELTVLPAGAAPLRVRPSSCGSLVPVAGLARGNQAVAIVASPGGAGGDVTGTCRATIVPGQRVLATCTLEP